MKSLSFHDCLPKGVSNFECLLLDLHTLNYHNVDTKLLQQNLSNEVRNLQREYQDLEMKGAQEQDHLLFELGRLGEELLEKNKEFGALMEKLSLTTKALQVAEEKIEHLESIDKQRNHHFKELQEQCAEHEKEQRDVRKHNTMSKY